jgi:hypothetical protein
MAVVYSSLPHKYIDERADNWTSDKSQNSTDLSVIDGFDGNDLSVVWNVNSSDTCPIGRLDCGLLAVYVELNNLIVTRYGQFPPSYNGK